MRVDAGMAYLNANQKPQLENSQAKAPSSFTDRLMAVQKSSPDEKDSYEVDFTSMTKKELFDWMNRELKAGRMTVDESTPFVGLAMDARITETGELIIEPIPDDTKKVNFYKNVSESLEYAELSRMYDTAETMALAKEVMDRYRNGDVVYT